MEMHKRVIRKLAIDVKKLDKSAYQLANGKIIFLRTSKKHSAGNKWLYWYGFHRDRFKSFDIEQLFILFICGSEEQILVIPAVYMLELLDDVETASDSNWKIKIYEHEDQFEISVTGKKSRVVTDYLNHFYPLFNGEIEASVPDELLPARRGVRNQALQEVILAQDHSGSVLESVNELLKPNLRSILPWWDHTSIYILKLSPRARAGLIAAGFLTISEFFEVDMSGKLRNISTYSVIDKEIWESLGSYLRNIFPDICRVFFMNESPIFELGLPNRIHEVLLSAGVRSITELVGMTSSQVRNLPKVGAGEYEVLKKEVAKYFSFHKKVKSMNIAQSNTGLEDAQEESKKRPIKSEFNYFIPWWNDKSTQVLHLSSGTHLKLIRSGVLTICDLSEMLLDRSAWRISGLSHNEVRELRSKLKAFIDDEYDEEVKGILSVTSNKTELAILGLTTRPYNALMRNGIRTIGELASLSRKEIYAVPQIGSKSIDEIRTKFVDYMDQDEEISKQSIELEDKTDEVDVSLLHDFATMIDVWLSELPRRDKEIVCKRYGLFEPKMILQEIGDSLSITRERTRQIEKRAIRRLRRASNSIYLKSIKSLGLRLINESGGILNEEEVPDSLMNIIDIGAVDPLGAMHLIYKTLDKVVWLSNLHVWVTKDLADIVDKIQKSLFRIVEGNRVPLKNNDLVDQIRDSRRGDRSVERISDKFIWACIRSHPSFFIEEDGKVGLEKWNKHRLDEMILALREIGEPVHYTVIAEKTNELLPEDQQTTAHNIHAHITRLPDVFIRVGKGVFGLAEWDLHDDGNLANAAYRVLMEAGRHMRLKDLTEDVLKTWRVKPGSIQAAIDNDARFVELQPGIYILQEHIDDTPVDLTTIDDLESRGRDKISPIEQEISFHEKKGIGSDILLDALRDIGIETTSVKESESEVSIGPIRFDPIKKILRCRGQKTRLDTKTSRLLQMLIASKGKTITHTQIMKSIWKRGFSGTPEVVDFHINLLREAIELDPNNPQLIQTVQGKGYRFKAK